MCCGADEELDLPPAVIEMLARYRALRDAHGWDWGGERQIDMFRWARFAQLGDVFGAYERLGDWGQAVRTVVGLDPPAGVVLVRDDGEVRCGPPRPVTAGGTVPLDVVIDGPDGVDVRTVDAGPGATVTVAGRSVPLGAALEVVPAARLRLRSPRCARWSVTDATGGAWFPDGVPHKWDVDERPFFHAADVVLHVPATPLTVRCARGLEFGVRTETVTPGGDTTVELDPPRRFDPAATGWYGGDLHVHLNYSGDLVCSPADAARMQHGEGLHLLSLVAGNMLTSRVYDSELLEAYAGKDLPWSGGDTVARAGVEYRNDLLGHVHALGPGSPPERYFTGHEASDHPEDWPPNHVACADLRHRHATVGYAHPVRSSVDTFFAEPRSVEARELVVDAALGLVDSLDVLSPFDDEGAVVLYHRLLSCGLRLAATAGTDTFLSFAHGPGTASNPPGWARVYAHLAGRPLSVAAFQDAVRAGRTMVTNGPWLTFTVNGHGPGAVLDVRPGERLDLVAEVTGDGIDRLTIEGPDGVLASSGDGRLAVTVPVEGPTWLAAVARGPGGPTTLDAAALAHTTPVYADVDGARVARAGAAEFCLNLIDGLETLIAEHGHFDPADRSLRLAQYRALLDRGRQYYRRVQKEAR
jgi:hypothetical protein